MPAGWTDAVWPGVSSAGLPHRRPWPWLDITKPISCWQTPFDEGFFSSNRCLRYAKRRAMEDIVMTIGHAGLCHMPSGWIRSQTSRPKAQPFLRP